MRSHVLTISEGMKDKKRVNTKIGVGSVVKAKVGDMGDNIREGRISGISKDVVVCAQAMLSNKKILFHLKDAEKKEMGSLLLQFYVRKRRLVWMSQK